MSKSLLFKVIVFFLIIFILLFAFSKRNQINYGKGEEDVVIAGSKIYKSGAYEYNSFIIEKGTLSLEVENNPQSLIIRAKEKIVIKEDAEINLSGTGCQGLKIIDKDKDKDKDCVGMSFTLAGGGGSHGGTGGYGSCIHTQSTSAYGFSDFRETHGEGGGIALDFVQGDDDAGGSGGGFVMLVAPTIIIDGKIKVNGSNGVGTGGGGAGGKVVLMGEKIVLNGEIEAVGGEGGTSFFQGAGGGAGGVILTNISIDGDGEIIVDGGVGGGAQDYYSGCYGGDGFVGKVEALN